MAAVSGQRLAIPQGDDISSQMKIQMRVTGFPWADVKHAPDFESYDQARQWLKDRVYDKLTSDGLDFRIMPKEFPCEFVTELERKGE
jgi:hypothetical protein